MNFRLFICKQCLEKTASILSINTLCLQCFLPFSSYRIESESVEHSKDIQNIYTVTRGKRISLNKSLISHKITWKPLGNTKFLFLCLPNWKKKCVMHIYIIEIAS